MELNTICEAVPKHGHLTRNTWGQGQPDLAPSLQQGSIASAEALTQVSAKLAPLQQNNSKGQKQHKKNLILSQ